MYSYASRRLPLSVRRDVWCAVDAEGVLVADSRYQRIDCRLSDCSSFIADHQADDNDLIAYRVYRYLFDSPELVRAQIKFDVTVLLTNRIAGELPRTRGHYHTTPDYRPSPFMDVYQVCMGRIAVQVHERTLGREGVSIIIAEAGDVLFLPPTMCHAVYNLGDAPAVFSNWCTRARHLDYAAMRATRGPALRILEFSDGVATIITNPAFESTPRPRCLKPAPSGVSHETTASSPFIFDWQDDRTFVALLNGPPPAFDWLANCYECDDSVTLDCRGWS
jgi:oxalate decarboxylase/phosphoglucose isomerase-like protein (cupin superfamily)